MKMMSIFVVMIIIGSIGTAGCIENVRMKERQETNMVIEIAAAELRDDITEEEFFMAADLMQRDFLSKQDGFVKRILLKNEGRTYTALVYWESLDAAKNASARAMDNESVRTFAASFKPETFRMDWFIPVKEWEKGW